MDLYEHSVDHYSSLQQFHQAYEQRMEQLIDSFEVEPGDRILELGLGPGHLALPLAERCNDCQLTCLDLYQPDLDKILLRAKEKGLDNIKIVNSDAADLRAIKDNSIDVVVSNFFLSEIISRRKLKKILTESKRVLKEGGTVYHSELSQETRNRAEELFVLADCVYAQEEVRWWEPKAIKAFLAMTGYKKIERSSFDWKLGLKGKGIKEALDYWEIDSSFRRRYKEELSQHGLELPQGYLIQASRKQRD